MREIITKAKIEKFSDQEELFFPVGTLFTQAAKDWIKQKRIKINFVNEEKTVSQQVNPNLNPNSQKESKKGKTKRAIVTVLGHDKVGIIAGVSTILASVNVNILDISQTVLEEFFTMIMIVDLTDCKVDFSTLRKMLEDKGEELEMKINLQHEDIFRFMHRI